jgi:hypothetical protein
LSEERVILLADVRAHRHGWSRHELAHLRRASNRLREAGFSIETESGLTDEGDPWFVFCDADSGEVVAHFARISGKNVAHAPLLENGHAGRIVQHLVDRLVEGRIRRRLPSATRRSTPAA